MLKLESRTGTVASDEQKVFAFLSDFRNFESLIPSGTFTSWKAEAESCSFTVPGYGNAGLRIVEKEPYRMLKITGEGMHSVPFSLWVHLKQEGPADTKVKLILHAELPAFLFLMASTALKNLLNMLIDSVEKYSFSQDPGRK